MNRPPPDGTIAPERSGSLSLGSVMWVPRDGRITGTSASSRSSAGRSRSAQTPVALTTLAARIENRSPNENTQRGIALVPERDKVFPNLTVAENLAAPFAKGGPGEDAIYGIFPRLADLRGRTAGLLSGGERQMLAIASALMCGPQLLLVDELSLGLAPVAVEDLMQRLLQIRNDLGITILIVEQSAAAALQIAEYGYVLENGRVVLDGDAERLRNHDDIREFYLGQSVNRERRSYRDVKQYRRSRRWYG